MIAKPKEDGGWGLKELHTFGSALVAKSIWKFISKEGKWQSILKHKYLGSLSTIDWIRDPSKSCKGGSLFLKDIVGDFPVIGEFLPWEFGNGKSVFVGKDNLVGVKDLVAFPCELNIFLVARVIITLDNVAMEGRGGCMMTRWDSTLDLTLLDQWTNLWQSWIVALSKVFIRLSSNLYVLKWIGNEYGGAFAVNMAYKLMWKGHSSVRRWWWKDYLGSFGSTQV